MEPQSLVDPGRTRKTHAERTKLSDSRMFEACIKLIVEQGTEKTTLKAVGEMAGYSRGLAGARFKSKAGLFCFVIKRVAEYWRDAMESLTSDKIGYSAISAAVDAHYQFCKKTPEPVRALYVLWFESVGLDSEIRDVVQTIHRRRLDDVIGWIERGIEAGELSNDIEVRAVASHFLISMFGIIYQWLSDPGQDEEIRLFHEQLKQTMRLLLPEVSSSKRIKIL